MFQSHLTENDADFITRALAAATAQTADMLTNERPDLAFEAANQGGDVITVSVEARGREASVSIEPNGTDEHGTRLTASRLVVVDRSDADAAPLIDVEVDTHPAAASVALAIATATLLVDDDEVEGRLKDAGLEDWLSAPGRIPHAVAEGIVSLPHALRLVLARA